METKIRSAFFLSINGFSQDGVTAHLSGEAVVVLIDGADLMAVLEERIDFVSLLLRESVVRCANRGNYLLIHSNYLK